MTHDRNTPLADLAVTYPSASRVFLRERLDYCCGGKTSLADACQTRGLDPDRLLQEIAAAEETARESIAWERKPLAELIDFIVERYHRDLRRELPELIALAEKVEDRHAEKQTCPRGLSVHLTQIHESVLDHLAKEEQVLFPLILRGLGSQAGGPVQAMEYEHRDHGMNLQRTREMAHDLVPPPEACPTWQALYLRLAALEADLMEHIHLENNILFPRALRES